jgi:CDP-glucose 4,6-dehydratase
MMQYKDFYARKRVMITGHTGFKGAWLTQILLDWGADVIGVSLLPRTSPNLFSILKLEANCKNYFTDVRDFSKLREIFLKEKPEIVFHLAAQAIVLESYKDPLGTYCTNVLGTANLLESIGEAGTVRSAVMVTSDKVYENVESTRPYNESDLLGGRDPYSASKAAADIIIRSFAESFFNPKDYGASHRTLIGTTRAGNVIGGGDWAAYRVVPDIIRAIYEKKQPVPIRNPESIRPWEHVLEPLSGYLLLARRLYEGEKELAGPWNFGPDDGGVANVLHVTRKSLEILGQGSYHVLESRTTYESRILMLDTTKAKSLLGWKTTFNINENLAFTIDWYKNFYGKLADPLSFTRNQIKSFFETLSTVVLTVQQVVENYIIVAQSRLQGLSGRNKVGFQNHEEFEQFDITAQVSPDLAGSALAWMTTLLFA